MKFNKFLMVCILLAIVTIGAVSAADNVTQNDAVAAESDSSDSLVGESYSDDDFYITVQENYTQDKNDWNSNELIYISSYSKDNGTFSILVDDVEKQSLNITNGYFSIEDNGYGAYEKYYAQVYPNDLGLDLGTYNVKVKYNQKTLIDSSVTLREKEDFDIYMLNPYYCEEEYWTSPSFIIIDSNHFNTGTLEILVNGNRRVSYAVNNGSFEEIADCSNRSRYLAASDVVDGYGTYDIKITFTQNGATETLRDENVIVAEREPTTNPKLELYFDLYTVNLPADDIAYIYLPWEATGTLNIRYNNVNENITYSKGQASHYMHAWNLNHLGENEITVTYKGDDFGPLTASGTVLVVPSITAPSFVSTNENFTITMCTHEWVSGNFNVYDYNNGTKGKLLASSKISNRYSTVELSSDTVGLNRFYLEFDYPGGDYPLIQEVYVVENSQNITVDVSDEIETGSDLNISFNAPESPFTFIYISVDGNAPEYYLVENGEFKTAVSGLSAGYHKVSVEYNDGIYVDGKLVGEVYHNTFKVNVGSKTAIETNDVNTKYDSGEMLLMTLKDNEGNVLSGKNISINLDGVSHTVTTNDKGQAALPIELHPGNYSAEILFEGDGGYLSSSVSAKIAVEKLATVLSSSDVNVVYGDESSLVIGLKDEKGNPLSGKEILVDLSGSNLKQKTDLNGQVLMPITLNSGDYVAVINFNGDEDYNASSASAKIVVDKLATVLSSGDVNVVYGDESDLVIALKDEKGNPLSGKEILVDLSGSNLKQKTDLNGQVLMPITLNSGNYTAIINFNGDENYNASSAFAKIIINKRATGITAPKLTTTYNVAKNLVVTLKDDNGNALADKNITIVLKGNTYTRTSDGNGQVKLSVSLPAKTYTAEFSFADDDNYLESNGSAKVVVNKATPKMTASSKTFKAKAKTKKVTVTLKNNKKGPMKKTKVTLTVNKKTYKAKTTTKGVATFTVKLTKKGKYNAVFKYAGSSNYKPASKKVKITVK